MLRLSLLLALLCGAVSGYNILVTVMGISGSQNLLMYRFSEQLAERGHSVTILRGIVDPKAKSPKPNKIRELTFDAIRDPELLRAMKATSQSGAWDKKEEDRWYILKTMQKVVPIFAESCENLLTRKDLLAELRNQTFDVAVIHFIDFCGYGLAEMLGIKGTIYFTTAYIFDPMVQYSGLSAPASFVPSAIMNPVDAHDVTIGWRAKNYIVNRITCLVFDYLLLPPVDEVFQRMVSKEFPKISDMVRRTQLFFVNADPFFEPPRPVQHNFVYVGGLTMTKDKSTLSEEWTKKLASPVIQKHGFGLLSMGTVVDTSKMPMEVKNAIISALARLPQFFFVRLAGDLPDISKHTNIEYVEWLPQKELMRHGLLRVFFTHAGYNSITEVTYAGVPVVMMPVYGDQVTNARRIERVGMGRTLDSKVVDSGVIYETIRDVIETPEYSQNAKRVSSLIQRKPFTAAETAAKWVEFLAEFKELPLRPASADMGWVQLYNVDLLVIVGVVALLVVKLIVFMMRKFWSMRKVKLE